jgi:murein DD-endopeptidase MepM/ murein hydrolase activator NlpD
LASTNFPNGKKIAVGTQVNTGDKLSKTGNTGMYNCEKLAAHLHFELRTTADPKNHVNPVPYFNIDWSTIRTANAIKYPGRLSGDNPHPKF